MGKERSVESSDVKVYFFKNKTNEGMPAKVYIVLDNKNRVIKIVKKILTKDKNYFGVERKFWDFYYSEERILFNYATFLNISKFVKILIKG